MKTLNSEGRIILLFNQEAPLVGSSTGTSLYLQLFLDFSRLLWYLHDKEVHVYNTPTCRSGENNTPGLISLSPPSDPCPQTYQWDPDTPSPLGLCRMETTVSYLAEPWETESFPFQYFPAYWGSSWGWWLVWAREQGWRERKRAFMVTRKAHLFWGPVNKALPVLSDCIMIQPKELLKLLHPKLSVRFRVCLTSSLPAWKKGNNNTHTPLRQLVSTLLPGAQPCWNVGRVLDSPISPTTWERAFATVSWEGSSDPITQSTKRHCSFVLQKTLRVSVSISSLSLKLRHLEGSEILLFWQANKLACYSFLAASRRYTVPGLEAKDFITHGRVKKTKLQVCIGSLPLKFHRAQVDAKHNICACVITKEPCTEETLVF